MASLAKPHWETVTQEVRELLAVLGQSPLLQPFYLAGGTGLALRLGHRMSLDLDLFANIETLDDQLRHSIVEALLQEHTVERLQDSVLGLVLNVDGQPCSFFSYGFPLLAPTDSVSGLQVAGLLDIGLMKLDAIAGRGTRKDFYDLYFIAPCLSLDELFARSADKYPHSRDFGMRVLTALVDFDIADRQDEPTINENYVNVPESMVNQYPMLLAGGMLFSKFAVVSNFHRPPRTICPPPPYPPPRVTIPQCPHPQWFHPLQRASYLAFVAGL